MKIKIRSLFAALLFFYLVFFVWSSYPVQEFVAPMYSFFGVGVGKVFDRVTEKEPSVMLVGHLDDGNFYLAGSALSQLCSRGENPKYFDTVKRMTEHEKKDVRQRAYKVLYCLDKQKANAFYLNELTKLDPGSREYEVSLLLAVSSKSKELLPMLLNYFERPKNWFRAGKYFTVYGDPAALPLLYEIKEKVQTEEYKKFFFPDTLDKLDEAIRNLMELKD